MLSNVGGLIFIRKQLLKLKIYFYGGERKKRLTLLLSDPIYSAGYISSGYRVGSSAAAGGDKSGKNKRIKKEKLKN